MDSRKARLILLSYRPGGSDASEPEVKAALELADRDPELKEWLNQHCATQVALQARFREIPVPDGLMGKILSGQAAPRKIVWWRNPMVLAAAAVVVLLAGLSIWWFPKEDEDNFASYRSRMVSTALRNYGMQMVSKDLRQIRDYLRENSPHGDYVLAAGLEKLPGEGCGVIKWHGRLVSLICLNGGKSGDLFLFVVNRAEIGSAPGESSPQFMRVNKLMTASWSLGSKTYLLAGQGDENTFHDYF